MSMLERTRDKKEDLQNSLRRYYAMKYRRKNECLASVWVTFIPNIHHERRTRLSDASEAIGKYVEMKTVGRSGNSKLPLGPFKTLDIVSESTENVTEKELGATIAA
ncbi:hypothetical protein T10_7800 [Trichinella papuae]|uniref:Uncharacterized protein n=1 Tax=Trichinella papuae TaxID=268474 RepID=A0A0V1M4A1_9BILA|nr:hypothetical protein T10_7800 [Trichinella papuae]